MACHRSNYLKVASKLERKPSDDAGTQQIQRWSRSDSELCAKLRLWDLRVRGCEIYVCPKLRTPAISVVVSSEQFEQQFLTTMAIQSSCGMLMSQYDASLIPDEYTLIQGNVVCHSVFEICVTPRSRSTSGLHYQLY